MRIETNVGPQLRGKELIKKIREVVEAHVQSLGVYAGTYASTDDDPEFQLEGARSVLRDSSFPPTMQNRSAIEQILRYLELKS